MSHIARVANTLVEEKEINGEKRVFLGNLLLRKKDEAKVTSLIGNQVRVLIESRRITLLPDELLSKLSIEI